MKIEQSAAGNLEAHFAPRAIPVHIISGFLGAGKTTLLKHLLSQKPAGEVWAVLMNEFGQIGVDQQLLPQDQGLR